MLALRQPPPVETFSTPTISPVLQQFLNQLGCMPACAIDARFNVVAQNSAHCIVFGDFASPSERGRNLTWRLFTGHSKQRNAEWEELVRLYVAQFRVGYGRFINDPWWTGMIDDLSRISPEFRELWARHDVLNVSEGHKTMHHPLAGELVFDSLFLQTVDSSDLRILIHTPHINSGTAEKIERLLAHAAEPSA